MQVWPKDRHALDELFNGLRGIMYLQKQHEESVAAFLDRAAADLEALFARFPAHKTIVDYFLRQYGSRERMGRTLSTVSYSKVKQSAFQEWSCK